MWRPGGKLTLRPPEGRFAPESLFLAMRERYGDAEHRVLSLDTGSEFDVQFKPGGSYAFSCAAFDHTSKRHAYSLAVFRLGLLAGLERLPHSLSARVEIINLP